MFNRLLKKKIATTALIAISVAAFATLGDGGKTSKNRSLLSLRSYSYNYHTFSLKSGYNYRGTSIIDPNKNKYVMLNTVVTYQKGNATYILPMKKRVLLDKIKFAPTVPARY
ncbi:MAG: hypothetical protein ABR502_04500 [Chitinophagaceae bacterium]